MISTGFLKYQSGFVSNGTEYLKCYSSHTERNYSFSYKFIFGRIICIRLKPSPARNNMAKRELQGFAMITGGTEKGEETRICFNDLFICTSYIRVLRHLNKYL